MIRRIIASPPCGDINRRVAEDIAGAVVVIAVQHGPFHYIIEYLALYLGGIGGFYLGPGALGDIAIVIQGFFKAETFHFFANAAHQGNNGVAQGFGAVGPAFCHGGKKIFVVAGQAFRLGLADLECERIALGDFGGVLLDYAEQDHGQDLVERFFQKNGCFYSGQTAFDAVAFDLDLGRQVLKLALIL